jgi:hypothetical protein
MEAPFFSARRAFVWGMRAEDLTRDQAHAIHERLRPMAAYLTLLEERMEQRDFPRDDKLYRVVKRVRDAVQDVFLETHALGTPGMVRKAK